MAMLMPLNGKYYGTIVKLKDGSEINVWVMSKNNWNSPSFRQLEYWNMSLDEAIEDGMMSDSHFESTRGFIIASLIELALEEAGE